MNKKENQKSSSFLKSSLFLLLLYFYIFLFLFCLFSCFFSYSFFRWSKIYLSRHPIQIRIRCTTWTRILALWRYFSSSSFLFINSFSSYFPSDPSCFFLFLSFPPKSIEKTKQVKAEKKREERKMRYKCCSFPLPFDLFFFSR